MNIKLIEIVTDDEDFGPYLEFELPESKFKGYINIGEWYSTCEEHYMDKGFMDKYHNELLGLVEKWLIDGGLLKFTTGVLPKWSDLDPLVYNIIDTYRFEMGFVNEEDYPDAEELLAERVKAFEKAIEKYPALSNVISLDETQVSLIENGDAIILFGDCACYVNWWGYENE